jgi:hypothetical protein
MRTISETVFESFLTENGLPFGKIPEMPERATRTPDYLVTIGEAKVVFEVKELFEDENFKTGPVLNRIIGDHVRRRISAARKQVQFGAKQGIPSVLLVYNNLDPIFQWGTEDHDFTSAMYGADTLTLDRDTKEILDRVHGKDDFLKEQRNTSFSAVGRLSPLGGKWKVTLFENVFAKVKLPFDALPPCIEIKRVTITYSNYSLTH